MDASVLRDVGLKKLDTKLDGFERKIDQVIGFHQSWLDKHDAELDSLRQLLENPQNESFFSQEKRLRQWRDQLRHVKTIPRPQRGPPRIRRGARRMCS